jgi:hypothetical protein
MHGAKMRIWKLLAVTIILVSICSGIAFLSAALAQTQGSASFGSKVSSFDSDQGRTLSSFQFNPKIVFVDGNIKGTFDSQDPVYISITPKGSTIWENDIRLTQFGAFTAGSQVSLSDSDIGYGFSEFGKNGFPNVQVCFVDSNGDKAYGSDDPVYIDVNPGTVSPGDIRLTGYYTFAAGSRVTVSDSDNNKPTIPLPARLAFFNANGNTNIAGRAVYDMGDVVYVDTEWPFGRVTINDIRVSTYF